MHATRGAPCSSSPSSCPLSQERGAVDAGVVRASINRELFVAFLGLTCFHSSRPLPTSRELVDLTPLRKIQSAPGWNRATTTNQTYDFAICAGIGAAGVSIMPSRVRAQRPAMYNTPAIRNGGFGALQVEAITNRPLSIARRHLAASQLRMRDIEPHELSSGEWVRFLVMEERERERWMTEFCRRRRNSNGSTSSTEMDRETAHDKAEEAREEAEEAAREEQRAVAVESSSAVAPPTATGTTPSVSLWARQFDEQSEGGEYSARRPRHVRRAVTEGIIEAPPTYETAVRARTPPPAYEPRSDDEEEPASPMSPMRVRFNV